MSLTLLSKSAENTKEIAQNIARNIKAGDIVFLHGELGSGKTTFTQGLATGLAIKEQVKSPTFNIVRKYVNDDIALIHIDAYRLNEDEKGIELEEYYDGKSIIVIEWPENLKQLQPTISLTFQYASLDERLIKITFTDKKRLLGFEKMVAKWVIN